jgi:Regulator of Chromosome Condensation (RCC1) repeat protein/Big-like domain-containing protein
MIAATAFGCLKGPSPTSLGANDVRFDLSAQVTGGSSLAITVAYLDRGNTAVQLLQQTVPVSGATQSLPLTIDLTQCLADPNHLSVGSTCELLVTIALSQGGTVVDSTTVGPVVVTPGQVVHATTSVASVGRIDVYPTSLSLTPGAIGILRDTVFAVNNAVIPNASVTWTSADTTIARVNDSGAVTGVAAGTTHVTASSGGDSTLVPVVVSSPSSAGLVLAFNAVSFSAPVGGTLPTNARPAVTSSDTTTVTGLTATITYGSGGSTGWLLAYVSDSGFGSRVVKRPLPTVHAKAASNVSTPATLDVVPSTTNLAAGTYTATVTVTGTNATPVNLSVTYTVSAAASNPLVLTPDTVTFEEYGGGTILPTAVTITGSQPGLSIVGTNYIGLASAWLTFGGLGGTTFYLNPLTTHLPLGNLQGNVLIQDGAGDTATLVVQLNVSATFTKVVAGGVFSCGLTTGSTVYCWGSNSIGQLGLGSGGGPYAQPMPVAIPNAGLNGTPVIDITAGYQHACALMSSQQVYCWGYNVDGETGTGVLGDTLSTPIAISGLQASQVSAGGLHTCAVGYPPVAPYGAAAYCWGYDGNGELGTGAVGASQPSPVNTGQTFVSVTSGYAHTCAILDSNSPQVYCWGNNRYGQVGTDSSGLTYPTPLFVGLFAAVSAGGFHTCAMSTAGASYCWGENIYGQLGTGSLNGNQLAPVAVQGPVLQSIVAGYLHTCGLTSAGAAYCWGLDSAGSIGNGQNSGSVLAPAAVSGGLTFASLAPSQGGYHTCGLTTSSIAYCWGYNAFGQLGNASTSPSPTPVQVVGQPAAAGLTPGGGARVVKRPPPVKPKAKATAPRPARTY